MVAKAGTIISEQLILNERDAIVNDGSNLESIKGVLSKLGLNPVNIASAAGVTGTSGIKIDTNQGTFEFISYKPGGYWHNNNFVLQTNNGVKTRGTWDYDKLYMKSPGVTNVQDKDFNNIISLSELKPAGKVSTEDVAKVDEMWKDPKVSCVVSQPGVRAGKMVNGATMYILGQVVYYASGRKKLADKTMVNYNCSTEFKPRQNVGGQNVGGRFTKSVESLGVQGGKMDLQTLQTILKSLEGGEFAQTTPAQGTPDLAQLTAALNQLNA